MKERQHRKHWQFESRHKDEKWRIVAYVSLKKREKVSPKYEKNKANTYKSRARLK